MILNAKSSGHDPALLLAGLALQAGEYAIGAVIVHNGVIVGRGQAEHNL